MKDWMICGQRSILARISVIAALIAATGCDTVEFPKYNVLGDLRILTVVVDNPEVNPGDTVTFTPVLSDINGQGRLISFSVQGCIDPGVGIGAAPICTEPDPASIQSGTVVIPAGINQTYTGSVTTFSLTMPDETAMFTGRSTRDQYNGVAYLVFYDVSVSGGPAVSSFVRVLVSSSSKTQKNRNPSLTSVDLNGSPVTGPITIPSSATFQAIASPDSSETYQLMSNDNSFRSNTEELISTWFVSDGKFDFMRTIGTSENAWQPPDAAPTGRGIVVLVVTRDGRGGAAFQRVDMQ